MNAPTQDHLLTMEPDEVPPRTCVVCGKPLPPRRRKYCRDWCAYVARDKPPSDNEMRRWRSNRVRMERGRRAVSRWYKRTGRSMF